MIIVAGFVFSSTPPPPLAPTRPRARGSKKSSPPSARDP